ncbi:MAG: penicillin-binding transpeptidase domain-containing protein, partial [Candidatus Caldatribacteriota bacterium]|nr:penicillin-binding transpeptidase domain-containing protein [Candidatus Caldatribacteriota bacterium]
MRESSSVPEGVKLRLNHLWIFIIICFVVLMINLWYLQMIKGEELAQKAVENCIRSLVEEAPRGRIYDRDGKILVTNRPVVIVSIIPAEVKNLEQLSKKLSKILDISPGSIQTKVKNYPTNPFKTVKIFDDCKINKIIEIEEKKDELKGVILEVQPRRKYIYHDLAAHSLGYVGEINKEELQESKNQEFQGGDIIGKAGLEKYYDDILRGEKGGKEVEVDALGREITLLLHRKPIPGKDIILTIDKDLQDYGENLLYNKKGSIIVSNPCTGEILALVNRPSFDPNLFTGSISPEDWERLSTDPNYPLSNRS